MLSKLYQFIKFGTTGVLSMITSVVVLHILTHYLGVWYLLSAVLAFFPAFAVSFLLQKYWTFKENSPDTIKLQMAKHFFIITFGLVVNILLLAFFVEVLHLHYVLGQILSGFIIACYNFPLYRYIVFIENKKR